MSGPVGILHVIQQQWSIGFKEVLFWLGTISLNLAILNLLPLPVLDGGYVLLSLFELVTGRRLKIETIEKIVLPFAVLLILLLLYLTYNDVVRLFSRFFSSLGFWRG
jgi:regulator of sigma E protease